jgi:hypothetical protein
MSNDIYDYPAHLRKLKPDTALEWALLRQYRSSDKYPIARPRYYGMNLPSYAIIETGSKAEMRSRAHVLSQQQYDSYFVGIISRNRYGNSLIGLDALYKNGRRTGRNA